MLCKGPYLEPIPAHTEVEVVEEVDVNVDNAFEDALER